MKAATPTKSETTKKTLKCQFTNNSFTKLWLVYIHAQTHQRRFRAKTNRSGHAIRCFIWKRRQNTMNSEPSQRMKAKGCFMSMVATLWHFILLRFEFQTVFASNRAASWASNTRTDVLSRKAIHIHIERAPVLHQQDVTNRWCRAHRLTKRSLLRSILVGRPDRSYDGYEPTRSTVWTQRSLELQSRSLLESARIDHGNVLRNWKIQNPHVQSLRENEVSVESH